MKNNFKDKRFNRCYDCGWGEKGVHDMDLTFDQAYEFIKTDASIEIAEQWTNAHDTYFEYRFNTYMIADCEFDEEDWEGSDDY